MVFSLNSLLFDASSFVVSENGFDENSFLALIYLSDMIYQLPILKTLLT
jgi:hypothetical protein